MDLYDCVTFTFHLSNLNVLKISLAVMKTHHLAFNFFIFNKPNSVVLVFQ